MELTKKSNFMMDILGSLFDQLRFEPRGAIDISSGRGQPLSAKP